METRSITITIKGEGAKVTASDPNPKARSEAKAKEVVDSKNLSAPMAILANQVFEQSVRMAKQTAEYEVNKYYDTANDYVGKRNLNEAMAYLGMGVSLASAAIAGATVGAAGGPVGSAIGAAVGAGLYVGQAAANAALALDRQRLEVEQSDAQLAYSRLRAGYSAVSGSRGENL